MNTLPTSLDHRSKIKRRGVQVARHGRESVAGLFRELTRCGREQLIAGRRLALGDRPVTEVALDEERAAGVRQQHFERPLAEPVQEDPGADRPGHRAVAPRSPRRSPKVLPLTAWSPGRRPPGPDPG